MVVTKQKSLRQFIYSSLWSLLGAFLAAYSLEVFLIPNHIIDGGIIGISILLADILGQQFLYPLVIVLSIPFVVLAYRYISRTFVIQMIVSVVLFAMLGSWIGHAGNSMFAPYRGDLLEIVVFGGLLLGLGVGFIIRSGGCLDGTEILGILINKKYGFTVGSVVLAANSIIFAFAGLVYGDWHPSIQSLITFFIVIKIMDMVIVGLDEIKAVTILSSRPKEVSEVLLRDLGIGLTVLYGRGGYTGKDREVLYLIAERLQLADIKTLVHAHDPEAVVAIENLHEVSSGSMVKLTSKV